MDLFEVIENRRSIRKYSSEPVSVEAIDRLLEAARLAPSTSNTQSWKFKVVTDPAERNQIASAAMGQKFVSEAPAIIACCVDYNAFKEQGKQALKLVLKGAVRPSLEMVLRSARGAKGEFQTERTVIHGIINATIATEHIVLAAEALGLGTCWIRAFDQKKVESVLDLPDGVMLLCLLTVGYPDQAPPPRPRRALAEIRL